MATQSFYRVGQESESRRSGDLSRLFLIGEESKVDFFAVDFDGSPPLPCILAPVDASVRGCADVTGLVLHVPSPRDSSQVTAAVVEPVSVDVVAFKAVTRHKAQQLTVQPNEVMAAAIVSVANGVPSATQAPRPLVDPLGIGRINDGVGSDTTVLGPERYADNGIIGLHSDSPPSVTPRAVSAAPGYFASLNYATSDQIGGVV